jgi:type I restriction enzyme, S subunit
VANVQDGYLDLSLIKEIEIEKNDIHKYLLKRGDVLLTEGGDFDKLGRGAIWQGDVNPCLHQNHIFVVRPNDDILLPQFLSLLTSTVVNSIF